MHLCGSILQAGSCKILSLGADPRWKSSVAIILNNYETRLRYDEITSVIDIILDCTRQPTSFFREKKKGDEIHEQQERIFLILCPIILHGELLPKNTYAEW